MLQVFTGGNNDVDFWTDACHRKRSDQEWQDFLRGFRGGVDFPPSLFYRYKLNSFLDFIEIIFFREIMEAFPDAKVILTVRKPEAWYKSVKETIYQGNVDVRTFPMNVWNSLFGSSKFPNMMKCLSRGDHNRFNNGNFLKGYI